MTNVRLVSQGDRSPGILSIRNGLFPSHVFLLMYDGFQIIDKNNGNSDSFYRGMTTEERTRWCREKGKMKIIYFKTSEIQ